jgi:hypothetical protein
VKYQIVIYLLGEWVHFHRRPMIEAMGRNAQGVANILCVNPIWCARQVTARSPEPRLDRRTRIGLEKIYENLYVLTPLLHWPLFFRLLATYFHPIVRYLIGPQVQAALREIDASSKNRVTWIYHPWQIDCLGLIGERCVVYECYDEIRLGAFTDKPQPSIEKLERKLLRRADLVFVTAESLYESRSQLHHNVHYISNGTDFQLFSQIYDADLPVASDLLSIPLPRIGFVGNISNVLDFPLLEHVAVTNSTWSIVLIGPVHESAIDEVTALRRLSNVYFLGMKRYSELPCYLKGFDVAIIPFKINEFIYN